MSARSIFAVFLFKNNKRQARAKNDVGFYFIYFARAQLLMRHTDAIPYRPIFIARRA